MTKEEKTLIEEIRKDHPVRQFFDGKLRTSYCPSAREVLILLGKKLPDNKDKQD